MEHEVTAPWYDPSVLFSDPATWASVGLLIFVGVVLWQKVPGAIAKSLDDRSAKIGAELTNAEALRKEAEAKLADAGRRQAEAEEEAVAIVAAARREAEQLAAAASAALTERLALREKIAEERIACAEAEAIRDVKLAAVDTASKAAAAILTEQLSGKGGDAHFAASLDAVTKALAKQ
jgi:F-type H+-transporting ATPase subunit b